MRLLDSEEVKVKVDLEDLVVKVETVLMELVKDKEDLETEPMRDQVLEAIEEMEVIQDLEVIEEMEDLVEIEEMEM